MELRTHELWEEGVAGEAGWAQSLSIFRSQRPWGLHWGNLMFLRQAFEGAKRETGKIRKLLQELGQEVLKAGTMLSVSREQRR